MKKPKGIEEESLSIQRKDYYVNGMQLVVAIISIVAAGLGGAILKVQDTTLVMITALVSCVIIFLSALLYNLKVQERNWDNIRWEANIAGLEAGRNYFLGLNPESRKLNKPFWDNIIRKYYLLAIYEKREDLAKEILDKMQVKDEDFD